MTTLEIQQVRQTIEVTDGPTIQVLQPSLQVVEVGTQGPRGPSLGESEVFTEVPTGQINGANVTYFLDQAPMSGTVTVKLNGVEIYETADYTLSGQTITMLSPPLTGDSLVVGYVIG